MSTKPQAPPLSILSKIVFGHLEIESFFRVFRVFNKIDDPRDIAALTLFYGAYLSFREREAEQFVLSDIDVQGIRDVQTVINWMLGNENWQTEEDPYLSFSYHLLVRKEITRAEAAQFVSIMLHRPIEQDVWRKRVDRWQQMQKLPPIGQTKRKPRK